MRTGYDDNAGALFRLDADGGWAQIESGVAIGNAVSFSPDGETLSRRIAADINPLIDALWSQGYFNAELAIAIDGVALKPGEEPGAALVRRAEAYRNQAAVPITVRVAPST